jgi:hypothetical protein
MSMAGLHGIEIINKNGSLFIIEFDILIGTIIVVSMYNGCRKPYRWLFTHIAARGSTILSRGKIKEEGTFYLVYFQIAPLLYL